MIVEVDELRDKVREEGIGLEDVASGSGESKDPDIPVRLLSRINEVYFSAERVILPEERRIGPVGTAIHF